MGNFKCWGSEVNLLANKVSRYFKKITVRVQYNTAYSKHQCDLKQARATQKFIYLFVCNKVPAVCRHEIERYAILLSQIGVRLLQNASP